MVGLGYYSSYEPPSYKNLKKCEVGGAAFEAYMRYGIANYS